MVVTPEYRGKGAGEALLKFVEAHLKQRGTARLVLAAREQAIPFYSRCGYHIESDVFERIGIPHRLLAKPL